jgi:preprotein translocase SecE subunit
LAKLRDKKTQPAKTLSVRERAERAIEETSKPKQSESKRSSEKSTSEKRAKKKGIRRFHIIPRYFRDSYSELKTVTWPNRRETIKLTTAVILFATVFSLLVSAVDNVFSIIFKKVFLHG